MSVVATGQRQLVLPVISRAVTMQSRGLNVSRIQVISNRFCGPISIHARLSVQVYSCILPPVIWVGRNRFPNPLPRKTMDPVGTYYPRLVALGNATVQRYDLQLWEISSHCSPDTKPNAQHLLSKADHQSCIQPRLDLKCWRPSRHRQRAGALRPMTHS